MPEVKYFNEKVERIEPIKNKPFVVSFYSNKGGVGCTQSICSTGNFLSSLGFRVVVVDLNMPSPGLSNFFSDYKSVGLVDYMYERFIFPNRVPAILLDDIAAKPNNNLVLLPATYLFDLPYFNKVVDLQSTAFIEESSFWEILSLHINESFAPDVVLIDSSKGFNEWSVISNVYAADLILYFTPFFEGVKDEIVNVRKFFTDKKKAGINLQVVYSKLLKGSSIRCPKPTFCFTEFTSIILENIQ